MQHWRRLVRPYLPFALPSLVLFLSLLLLRHQLADDMGMTTAQATGAGLIRGMFYDALMVVGVSFVASIFWGVLAVPLRAAWAFLALFLWVSSLANVLYLRFFGIPLDWWIVEMHWQEVGLVGGSAAQLSLEWPVLLSACLALSAIVLGIVRPLVARALDVLAPSPLGFWQTRTVGVVRALVLLAVIGVMWRMPGWFTGKHGGPVAAAVSDNIVRQWWVQNFRTRIYAGVGTDWADSLGKLLHPDELKTPAKLLAQYRDMPVQTPSLIATTAVPADAPRLQAHDSPALAAGEEWPAYTKFAPDPAETRALRKRLGLPETGPINVIFLFSESTRAFEVLHPELGPKIMPRLRKELDDHGILFTTTYSSSFQAGQTVRGQYSTQCSMLPNLLGAAEYIAHTTTRVTCIQQFLKEHGYRTTWFNSYEATFHGKRAFETLHGMDEFYDGEFFRGKGITKSIGEWGLADQPVLQETLKKMEELTKDGKPFYANVLTISTHHPFSVVPEGPLPDDLKAYETTAPEWAGYLSRLHYADGAISDFLDALWKSPIADNTLVVFLGDHSSPVRPQMPVSPAQHVEVRFRIPLAFLTKNLPTPQKITYPVHQVDVVPTVAHVLGLGGDVTWVGRNILAGEGSPWLYLSGQILDYRVGNHACYVTNGRRPPSCYDVSGADPLFAPPTVAIEEDKAQSNFFERLAQGYMRALVLNRLQPGREMARAP